jgi:DNA-binding MarR family transcriptional regulator
MILEVVPLVMRTIRQEMRSNRGSEVNVPQFRILNFIRRSPQSSLTDVADHIGLTLPSISKMVDGLVERGWITREECASDRRRITLTLTDTGETMLASSLKRAQEHLSERLRELSNSDRADIAEALLTLQSVFVSPLPAHSDQTAGHGAEPQA